VKSAVSAIANARQAATRHFRSRNLDMKLPCTSRAAVRKDDVAWSFLHRSSLSDRSQSVSPLRPEPGDVAVAGGAGCCQPSKDPRERVRANVALQLLVQLDLEATHFLIARVFVRKADVAVGRYGPVNTIVPLDRVDIRRLAVPERGDFLSDSTRSKSI